MNSFDCPGMSEKGMLSEGKITFSGGHGQAASVDTYKLLIADYRKTPEKLPNQK
jgi:hypothetical protein